MISMFNFKPRRVTVLPKYRIRVNFTQTALNILTEMGVSIVNAGNRSLIDISTAKQIHF